jgi:hypothetical protein
MIPLLFRPAFDDNFASKDFSGLLLVISLKAETDRLRVPGVYDL